MTGGTLPTSEIGQFIQQIGFPAAIALFVLWRVEPQLRNMIQALHALREVMFVLAVATNPDATDKIVAVLKEKNGSVK